MKRIYGSLELGGARNFHDIFLCDEAPVDGANPSIHFYQTERERGNKFWVVFRKRYIEDTIANAKIFR